MGREGKQLSNRRMVWFCIPLWLRSGYRLKSRVSKLNASYAC
jgi:hypothetical protein